MISDNESHGAGGVGSSKVASNETLTTSTPDDKPLVVTTYVCSSSELSKTRKMIDENGNPLMSSTPDESPVVLVSLSPEKAADKESVWKNIHFIILQYYRIHKLKMPVV